MNLDNIKEISKLDKDEVAKSISLLPEQIKQVLDDTKNIKLPASYKKCSKIVINGMGGSNLGGWILKRLFSDQLKVSVDILDGYSVPKSVDKNTSVQFRRIINLSKDLWIQLENHMATIAALQQTNESLISFRLNDIMKTLTIFSVIVFPLTLLAAIFGMNTMNKIQKFCEFNFADFL